MHIYFINNITGYINTTKTIQVKIVNSQNLGIPNLPVQFTTSLGSFNENMPVYTATDIAGVATVTLDMPTSPTIINVTASYNTLSINSIVEVLDIPLGPSGELRIYGNWPIRVKVVDNVGWTEEIRLLVNNSANSVTFLHIKRIEHVYYGFFSIDTTQLDDGLITLVAYAENESGIKYSEPVNMVVDNDRITPRPLTLNLNTSLYLDLFEEDIGIGVGKLKLSQEDDEYIKGFNSELRESKLNTVLTVPLITFGV